MRVVLICRYDGSRYHGFQIQPNNNTIQEEIEKSLRKIHKKNVRIYMSGRTDSGVHAYGQVLHFDTDLNIPTDGWVKAINAMIPKDIRIVSAKVVNDEFHVRYNSIKKTYSYKLYFNFDKAKEALKYFIGEHDFSSFCSKNTSVEDKVRTIYSFKMDRDNQNDNIINFEITGNGFLYNMVRIIIGTIQDVAAGKYEPEFIQEILDKKERSFAGPKADASGLYLKEVLYDNDEVNEFIKTTLELY